MQAWTDWLKKKNTTLQQVVATDLPTLKNIMLMHIVPGAFWVSRTRVLGFKNQGFGFQGPGFWVSRTRVLGFKNQGSGFQGPGFWVSRTRVLGFKNQGFTEFWWVCGSDPQTYGQLL